MSHLQHINTFKMKLIEDGVTHPETQMGITLTAYTTAFIRFFTGHCIAETDRKRVMDYMLNYWNETFPVNGPLVIASVKNFYLRLCAELTHIKGALYVPITTNDVIDQYPTYADVPQYESLVNTLVLEIEHKYSHIKGA